jgi:TRAP-type C4-dicarboxylate transport system permease small subunit
MQNQISLFQPNRWLDLLARLSAGAAALSLYLVTALILYEILLRNVFHTSSGFSTEYSAYLLVFLVFFALPQTQRTGGMIYMEIVFDALPAKARRSVDVMRHVISLIYSAVVTFYIFTFTSSTCSLNQLSLYTTQTPLCIPQSFMVVGMVLLTVELLRGTIMAFLRTDAVESHPEHGSAL